MDKPQHPMDEMKELKKAIREHCMECKTPSNTLWIVPLPPEPLVRFCLQKTCRFWKVRNVED